MSFDLARSDASSLARSLARLSPCVRCVRCLLICGHVNSLEIKFFDDHNNHNDKVLQCKSVCLCPPCCCVPSRISCASACCHHHHQQCDLRPSVSLNWKAQFLVAKDIVDFDHLQSHHHHRRPPPPLSSTRTINIIIIFGGWVLKVSHTMFGQAK